jgi:general secretion pathway protein G
MSGIRHSTRKAFTLVEILIVVIILGILAAIVIPQFTNASSDARNSSLASTLQTLRSQIELYKLQHGDTLPNLLTSGSGWAPFTGTTSYGNPAQTFGPYMQATPSNPENGFSTVIDSTAAPGATVASGTGFVFDYNGGNGSGEIYGTSDTGGTTVAPY